LRGDLDTLPEPVCAHLLAVLREAVSNAVRHARATHLRIEIEVTPAAVVLTVSDDGQGLDPAVVSTSGLRNLRDRAEQLGGTCRWRPTEPHGTTVEWQVPLTSASPRAPAPTRQAQLMTAMRRVGRAATDGRSDPLTETATALGELVDADCVALIVEEDDEQLQVVRTRGFPRDADPRGRRLPSAGTLADHVLSSGVALRVDDVRANPSVGRTLGTNRIGPALVVPLRGATGVHGAISLARFADRGPFTVEDEELAMTLATHGALALDLALDLCGVAGISRPPLPAGR
jgi:hypothetical protein